MASKAVDITQKKKNTGGGGQKQTMDHTTLKQNKLQSKNYTQYTK
jgi:hypothetical protein